MRPPLLKATWHVYTSDHTYGGWETDSGNWAWVAHGPRGSQSGVERTPDEAVRKAHAASVLLSNEARA